MSPSPRKSTSQRLSPLHFVFGRHLPLVPESLSFIVASALDVIMTHRLLSQGGFYESNPVANYFIGHWGSKGMVYFKFGMVAFVCLLTQLIALKRVHVAQKLLQFATAIVSLVVIYSLFLLLRQRGV